MNKRNILLIDDSQAARDLVISILSSLDAHFIQAKTGEEGLEWLEKIHFDLIITDLKLSGISGIELCEQINKNHRTKGIPVIILSAYDSEIEIENGYNAGAEAYISKNEIKKTLLKTAHQVLSRFKFQRGKKILIAEDSLAIKDMVVKGLESVGFAVKAAENGKQAREFLQNERFDLCLTDIEMPEMNGFQLLEYIQSDSNLAGIPVIVMSTHDERSYIKRIIMQGAVSYLVKPFNLDQLVTMMEKVLSDQFILLRKEKERSDLERNLILASITSLISALEARDYYTRGHSEAVSKIVEGMLAIYGGSEKQVNEIAMAGKLHDIGKIGVRDSVLLKPAALSDEEFNHLKKHPQTGAEILKPIPSLHNIIPVVEHHHERMDGKGYPTGLRGDEIPLWARITSVADTYDALISDRPYRKGMSKDKALAIVDKATGPQLCPECVELFMKWLNDGKNNRKKK